MEKGGGKVMVRVCVRVKKKTKLAGGAEMGGEVKCTKPGNENEHSQNMREGELLFPEIRKYNASSRSFHRASG